MKRILLLIIYLFFSSQNSFCQLERSHWYFGFSAGIYFTSTGPVPDTNGINISIANSSCISDSNGNLLFYYSNDSSYLDNKNNVINNQHQIMLNGDSILGTLNWSQGCIIVPYPGNDSLFYLFHLDEFNQFSHCILYYSVINMQRDSGRGEVISKNNILCTDSLSYKITLVKHGNGQDWWIILHSQFGNSFYLYLITHSGINGPLIQTIGSNYNFLNPNGTYSWSHRGWMMPNKDGNKLIAVNGSGVIDLFDFDRCAGQLSNWQYLGGTNYSNSPDSAYYGCSFDSRNNYGYVSTYRSVWQFDLNATNIKSSFQMLHTLDTNHVFGALLNGPDDKIYCVSSNNWYPPPISDSINMNLSVVNYPFLPYPSCDFSAFSISCGGKKNNVGLPNIAFYELGALDSSICDSLTAINESQASSKKIKFYPNPSTGIINIEYRINNDDKGELTLYNVLGERVQHFSIVSNAKTWTFDCSSLSQGLYFYKLKINNNLVSDGKISLIK